MKNVKCITLLFIVLALILIIPNVSNATDTTYTSTSTINGVTVNWSYELNETDEIEELTCTNISDLSGNITIPATIDGKKIISIGGYAFRGAINITEVTIPDTVEKIGINAFENCTNLTKVNLPEGLKEFGWNVFEGCTGLTEFTIPKNVTSAQSIFKGCTNLTKITFEDGIKEIPAYVCSGVEGITEVTIPDSVEKIGINAFENCTNLKKITILDNVKDMGWGMAQSDDTVFVNHNDDLTIYCYEDSMAANYAIKYNIKYVYLTKPVTDNNVNNEENKNDEEKPKEEIPDSTESTQKPTTEKEDTTTATGKLPQTGLTIGMTLAIIAVLAGGVFAYFKYSKLRGI